MELIFKILLPVFFLTHLRGSIRAYSMPVSFLALARTLSLITHILIPVTMRLFLESQQYFIIGSLKILTSYETSRVSADYFLSTFAITYDFARNVLFLTQELSYSTRGLSVPTCFSHVLGCFAPSRDQPCGSSIKFARCFL